MRYIKLLLIILCIGFLQSIHAAADAYYIGKAVMNMARRNPENTALLVGAALLSAGYYIFGEDASSDRYSDQDSFIDSSGEEPSFERAPEESEPDSDDDALSSSSWLSDRSIPIDFPYGMSVHEESESDSDDEDWHGGRSMVAEELKQRDKVSMRLQTALALMVRDRKIRGLEII